jgi:hypothetical protein
MRVKQTDFEVFDCLQARKDQLRAGVRLCPANQVTLSI